MPEPQKQDSSGEVFTVRTGALMLISCLGGAGGGQLIPSEVSPSDVQRSIFSAESNVLRSVDYLRDDIRLFCRGFHDEKADKDTELRARRG